MLSDSISATIGANIPLSAIFPIPAPFQTQRRHSPSVPFNAKIRQAPLRSSRQSPLRSSRHDISNGNRERLCYSESLSLPYIILELGLIVKL